MPSSCCSLSLRSAVSHETFFKMADNIVSDSDSNWGERAGEDPINPIVEANRLGQTSLSPKKLK